MSEAVMSESLDRLRAEISSCATQPYLITVTAAQRPHCGTVSVAWDDDAGERILVAAPSSWPESEAAGLREVSVLWPPDEPGGYSLIVDGAAETLPGSGGATLAITLRRAVQHRRGTPDQSTASSCGSDCVPILGP